MCCTGANWSLCKQQQRGKKFQMFFFFLPQTFEPLLLLRFAQAAVCFQVLRLNGLTLAALGQAQVRVLFVKLFTHCGVANVEAIWAEAFPLQAASLLPQFVLQQQPDVLLNPQLINLNPQLAGPFNPQGPQLFLPNQGGQLTPMVLPNGQPDQLVPPQDPNNPNVAQQGLNPVQVRRRSSCYKDH